MSDQAAGPEEYRGFILDPVFHPPHWQVQIYPTFHNQVLPPERRMPASATREEAIDAAKRHVDAFMNNGRG